MFVHNIWTDVWTDMLHMLLHCQLTTLSTHRLSPLRARPSGHRNGGFRAFCFCPKHSSNKTHTPPISPQSKNRQINAQFGQFGQNLFWRRLIYFFFEFKFLVNLKRADCSIVWGTVWGTVWLCGHPDGLSGRVAFLKVAGQPKEFFQTLHSAKAPIILASCAS